MMNEQQQEQASLYVTGALPADERKAFEAELRGNAELREFVRDLQRAASSLAMSAPAVPLPPGQHTLQIVLGTANHSVFDPPLVSDPLTITVK